MKILCPNCFKQITEFKYGKAKCHTCNTMFDLDAKASIFRVRLDGGYIKEGMSYNDVVNNLAAIDVVGLDFHPLLPCQILQNPTAERTQIPGDNQVVIIRLSSRIPQVRQNGIRRRRSHRRAHIIDVCYPKVHHFAKSGTFYRQSRICATHVRDEYAASPRHRPL